MNEIFGRKPILEALEANESFEKIYICYGQHGRAIDQIKKLAKASSILIKEIPLQKFKSLEKERNTQGVIAVRGEVNYSNYNEALLSLEKKNDAVVLLLDSIQDPQNLGAILRTAECSGVDFIFITTHKSAPITDTVIKTSAGAVLHLKLVKVKNLSSLMDDLKEIGFWITGTSLEGSKDYTKIDYSGKCALVMGNEEKGIRPKTAKHCDHLVKINMKGKIQSLNVSVATGVLLFEILKQRNS